MIINVIRANNLRSSSYFSGFEAPLLDCHVQSGGRLVAFPCQCGISSALRSFFISRDARQIVVVNFLFFAMVRPGTATTNSNIHRQYASRQQQPGHHPPTRTTYTKFSHEIRESAYICLSRCDMVDRDQSPYHRIDILISYPSIISPSGPVVGHLTLSFTATCIV